METCNSGSGSDFGSGSDLRSVSVNRKQLENRLKIRIKVGNNDKTGSPESGSICDETALSINRLRVKFLESRKAPEDLKRAHGSAQTKQKLANYAKKQAAELKNSELGSSRSRREKPVKLKLAAVSNSEQKASNGNSVAEESGEEKDNSLPLQKSTIDCSLCGRNFPSKKSLFGHMRCHPERDWRGIVPPERVIVADKNSSLSSAVSNSGANTSNQLPDSGTRREKAIDCATMESCGDPGNQTSSLNWSVTAKRGRKNTVNETSKLSDWQDQVSDVAHSLMILANANSKSTTEIDCRNKDFESTELKIEQNVIESEAGYGRFGSEKSKFHDVEDGFSDLGQREKEKINVGSENKNREFGSETVKILGKKQLNSMSEHRKKRRKIRSLETVQNLGLVEPKVNPTIVEKYRCSTCNKSFSSRQALGGHRTGHKKWKNSPTVGELDEFAAEEVAEEESCLMADPTRREDLPESLPETHMAHRCKICNKEFPTGQALGGHKRCHWTGDRPVTADISAPAVSSVSSVEIPADGRKIARKLLDFDLNEPPVVEEEDLASAISMVDVVPAFSQSLGLMLKNCAQFYSHSVSNK